MYLMCAHPVWVISPFGSFNFLLSLFGNMEIAVLDCSCPTCFLALQWLSLARNILVPGILLSIFLLFWALMSSILTSISGGQTLRKCCSGFCWPRVVLRGFRIYNIWGSLTRNQKKLAPFYRLFHTNLTSPVHEVQAKQQGCTPPRLLG